MLNKTPNDTKRPGDMPKGVDAVNTVNTSASPQKKPFTKTVIVVGLACLAVLGLKYAPASAASPVSCSTKYYSNALHTSCSDGSSSVCYDGGSCHYQSAADRQQAIGGYEELLRGAGFCNIIRCVK